ncbi:MAG: aminotransferase class I/II-fold pyridoxal phosphate-dependent enzyme, partial [Bifidobacteriaceae bacterium]|nr:aminotransferase class I/II-fold pyridoxal phosphate-dependent enzyme [Bifidobacteriaceae bacterium]
MSEAGSETTSETFPEFSARIDRITVDQLRAGHWVKWDAHPDALGASIAEMDFPMAPVVARALHDPAVLSQTGYLSGRLAAQARQATVEFQASRHDWRIDPDQVVLTTDVLDALGKFLLCFLDPGAPVIVPTPAYMPFVTLPALYRHPVIEVPLSYDPAAADPWRLAEEDLDRAFAAGGRALIWCNPHNPIGKAYSPEEMERVAAVVEAHHGLVFNDEIHAPLIFSPARHVPYASLSQATARHTVTAFSASKSFNIPGLKCAQMVVTDPERRALLRER